MENLDNPAVEPIVEPASATRQSLFRETPWRLTDLVVGFAPLIVIKVAITLIDPASLPAVRPWIAIPLTMLQMVWLLVFPLWIARRRVARFPRLVRLRAVLGEGLRALLVMLALNATLFLFFGLLSYFFGDSWNSGSPFEPIARSPNWAERLGFIVLACAVAPVAEEVFFRGMLYSFLRQRLHLIVAVLIQAVVFALMHPFDLAQRAVVFILGVGLGLTYEWRKTLLTPILLHALLNAFWLAMLAWGIAADADAPRLGVFGESHDGGCLITEVVPGSPAQSAGLQVGDLVTAVDGRPVADWRRFTRMIRSKKVGDRVSIDIMRNGTANRVEAVLVKLRE